MRVWGGVGGLASATLVALVVALIWAGPAEAHKTNLTRGLIQLNGPTVTYALSFSPHDIAVAAGMKTDFKTPLGPEDFAPHLEELRDYITGRLMIESDRGNCTVDILTNGEDLPETFQVTATAQCTAPPRKLTVRFLIFFFDVDPLHRNTGRLILPVGGQEEFLFDAQVTEFTTDIAQPAPPPPWHERLFRLIDLGIEHILLGVDHILFVLLLILAVPRASPGLG
jgi:hypothetical protein